MNYKIYQMQSVPDNHRHDTLAQVNPQDTKKLVLLDFSTIAENSFPSIEDAVAFIGRKDVLAGFKDLTILPCF